MFEKKQVASGWSRDDQSDYDYYTSKTSSRNTST